MTRLETADPNLPTRSGPGESVTDTATPATERSAVTYPARQPSLYRVFWRWHFYAGVLVIPVLLIAAVTGAMYIFKDELESVLYSSALFVQPQPTRIPIEDQVAAARSAVPVGYRASGVVVSADPTRATAVNLVGKDLPFRQVYVNQHTGAVQDQLGEDNFFRWVLKLHRSLFLGTTGRVVVELMTGWCIILLVTGLYLWWPRGRSAAGVLYPRLRAKPYVVLRDLHTVAGFWLLPVALCIAITGLMYTQVWGTAFQLTALKTGAYDAFLNPAENISLPGSGSQSLDDAFAVARAEFPNADTWTHQFPAKDEQARVFLAGGKSGPIVQGIVAVDRSAGVVIDKVDATNAKPLALYATLNYSLHVGSVMGTPTKIIWLIACLVLMALPVTGLWMWWKRRPKGRTGLPRRPDVRVPWPLVGLIVLLGVLLPVVGASMVLILLGEWVVGRVRRLRSPDPVSPAALDSAQLT
jgi:uncharacterized iron-regulated membrane protein